MKKILFTIALFLIVGVSDAQAYSVERGDTLCSIGEKVGLSCLEVIQLNPQIENPDLIYVGEEINTDEDEILGATNLVAGVTYTLAGSGITASATSITLQSLTIPQTGRELVDADFSTTFYITLEPGNTRRQEIASCTTVTQNANDTATLSGCIRGLLPFTPFTASSTYDFAHAGGTRVIFSDPPQVFNEFSALGNSETITGLWTYDIYPIITSTLGNATGTQQLITLGQANGLVNQGAATSTEAVAGISELSTQTEMASSTNFGAERPLVLQARYATSSPRTTGSFTVITSSTGQINNTFGGAADSLATLDSSTLVVENPASATSTPTANSILLTDSNSFLTDEWTRGNELLATSTASVNAEDTASTTLLTYTLPGGLLDTSNVVKIKMFVSDIGFDTSDILTLVFRYNGLPFATSTITEADTAVQVGMSGSVTVYLMAAGATNSQVGRVIVSGSPTDVSSSGPSFTNFGSGTSAIDSTTDQVITVVGSFSTGATANNEFSVEGYVITLLR